MCSSENNGDIFLKKKKKWGYFHWETTTKIINIINILDMHIYLCYIILVLNLRIFLFTISITVHPGMCFKGHLTSPDKILLRRATQPTTVHGVTVHPRDSSGYCSRVSSWDTVHPYMVAHPPPPTTGT
jgi:hypothetical protein